MTKQARSDRATEVARTEADAANGVAMYGRFFPPKVAGLAGIRTTLALDTERGKSAVVSAGSPGSLEIPADDRLRLIACDVACFWDAQVDEETGELSEFVRTVFYTKDGQTFRTSSPHAPHFVARLIDVYGLERFQAGIPITVCERTSKRERRTYHDFRVELPAE